MVDLIDDGDGPFSRVHMAGDNPFDEGDDFDLLIIRDTEKAYMVSENDDGTSSFWLPKSQVTVQEYHSKGKRFGKFEMPDWLAEEKGLF